MIKPTQDYVLILPEKREAKTASGIVLTTSDLPAGDAQGRVVVTADKVTDVKTGDRVLYTQYGMQEIDDETLATHKYHLVREQNIYAILADD